MTAALVERRAVVYARYSTDLQKDRSIDDQIALCREHALRRGYEVLAAYTDRALTSASLIGRDGILQLVADAKARAFDVVIVESLDRISRDQEDLAGVFKRLSFSGVDIIAVHDGVADAMQIGIRGLLGSIFLTDLKHKVRRGLAGVVSDGRLAGGLCYGYDAVPGKPGERTINEQQAAVIRRIFEEYAAGDTPRTIAIRLNAEGVAPPRGAQWNASTINGNKARSYGILQNEIYHGKIVWNRVTMVRDPDTGKRVSRANPPSEWKTAEALHLAIMQPDLFRRVQEKKERASIPHPRHVSKPKRILSGLLRCRFCGGSLVSKGKSDGVPRVRCAAFSDRGACDNNISYRLDRIESAVLRDLRELLATPSASQAHLDHALEQKRNLIDEAIRNTKRLEDALELVSAEQDRLIDMVGRGLIKVDRIADRVRKLESERSSLEAQVAIAKLSAPSVKVSLETVRSYSAMVHGALEGEKLEGAYVDAESFNAIRGLLHSVVVGHDAESGYSVETVARLSALTPRAAGADPITGNISSLRG